MHTLIKFSYIPQNYIINGNRQQNISFCSDDKCSFNSIQKIQQNFLKILQSEYKFQNALINVEFLDKQQSVFSAAGSNINQDTIFAAGSITKTYTAALILKLQEMKLLDINDKITKHLPLNIAKKIPNAEYITIKQLLNHSSGLGNLNGGKKLTQIKDYDELYDFINTKDLTKQGKFNYSNLGYIILGSIIKEKTGEDLNSSFEHYLFEPLGLNKTYLGYPVNNQNLLFKRHEKDFYIKKLGTPDGGICTSVSDINKFFKELFINKSYLSEKSIKQMIETDLKNGYGFGIINTSNNIWHNGQIKNYISSSDEQAVCIFNPKMNVIITAAAKKDLNIMSILKSLYPITAAKENMHITELVFEKFKKYLN